MASLEYSSITEIFTIRVDNSGGYGLPYEIIGSKGSYCEGTTNDGGIRTQVHYNGYAWYPDYDDETLELYIGYDYAYKGSWCWNGSSLSSGECEEEYLNKAIYAIDVEAELTDYNSVSKYASIDFNITIKNRNPDSVYGRIEATVTDGNLTRTYSETINDNRWIDDGDVITISYDWYMDSTEKTFTVRVNCHCYEDSTLSRCRSGTSYGTMVSSGYYTFTYPNYNLKVTISNYRPSKFCWIGSPNSSGVCSDSLNNHKGEPISDYITASKWKALQNNVNAVRAYRNLGNFSFDTYSSGETITAKAYNDIADAINGISSGKVSKVTKGVTPITTEVMMSLQDGINSIT